MNGFCWKFTHPPVSLSGSERLGTNGDARGAGAGAGAGGVLPAVPPVPESMLTECWSPVSTSSDESDVDGVVA